MTNYSDNLSQYDSENMQQLHRSHLVKDANMDTDNNQKNLIGNLQIQPLNVIKEDYVHDLSLKKKYEPNETKTTFILKAILEKSKHSQLLNDSSLLKDTHIDIDNIQENLVHNLHVKTLNDKNNDGITDLSFRKYKTNKIITTPILKSLFDEDSEDSIISDNSSGLVIDEDVNTEDIHENAINNLHVQPLNDEMEDEPIDMRIRKYEMHDTDKPFASNVEQQNYNIDMRPRKYEMYDIDMENPSTSNAKQNKKNNVDMEPRKIKTKRKINHKTEIII